MIKIINVLIIEDEPLIIDAYTRVLKKTELNENSVRFIVHSANNCDSAILMLKKSQAIFDLIFLDIRIPKCQKSEITCGEDLGIEIRKMSKHSKIIVSTSYSDAFRIFSVLNSVNPDAYLVKSDINEDILIEVIRAVTLGNPYYSTTVTKIFRKQSSNKFVIDNIDKKMLYELSNGTKMNELPNIIPLSMAALERRKRILKDMFNVEDKGDRGLLMSARKRGFI